MDPRGVRSTLLLLAIAAAYLVTAKLGLTMAIVAEQVTVVWPPSGIALAAVLLLGGRVWPGIWIGAFAANVTSNEPILVAASIATGNTFEALTGAWLLERLGRFDLRLARLRDVFSLALLAAGLSTIVAASVGSLSLCLGGLQPWESFPTLFRTWWLGDGVGDLLVAPLVLSLATSTRRQGFTPARIAEAMALLGAFAYACVLAFRHPPSEAGMGHPIPYIVFPFLVWSAVRFGPLGAATAVAVSSVFAIWNTASGGGPFAAASPGESLMLVQMFLSVAALTALTLGAAIAERRSAQARRTAELDAVHAIAGAASLEAAAPKVLEAICRDLDWDLGALWTVDPDSDRLRLVEQWHRRRGPAFPRFESASRSIRFERGTGLPGRVWASRAPAWIPDVTRDANFPRAPLATEEGLRGAFGFPVVLEGTVVAVLEFFSREIRQPDATTLASFAAIGNELGQYIGRKRAEDALRESDRRKDEFLAVLAHELRNPLAPVRNAFEIVRLGPQTAELQWASEVIDRQISHLTRLVDDLLDVARISAGKVHIEREPLDVREVVARAVDIGRKAIEGRGQSLRVSVPGERIVVSGDRVRLAQAVGNLLDNAGKYGSPGGEVSLSVERVAGSVAIRVKDGGIGIGKADLTRIFEFFAQGGGGPEKTRGGLGVGLGLVRQFVEMHGGAVAAASAGEGTGSEFTITLPVLGEGAATEPTRPAASQAAEVPRRRVLVVDDNRDSADTMAALLSFAGHEVEVCYTGEQAIEAAASFRPEVAVLDLGLPGKDGFEVARQLRGEHGSMLLIAMTGYGQEEDRRRSAEVGFDVHMTKPVDPAVLLERIARPRA
jgi:signal transduction histidine kinase/integral membrane sensor domain MASE1/CheY-like chemotaxis protein